MPLVDRGDDFTATIEEPEVNTAQEPIEPEVKEPEVKEPEVNEPEVKEPETLEVQRDDKGRFIPKSRFDEQVRKEREGRELAERRLAELETQLRQSHQRVTTGQLEEEIKGLEKQYTKLVLQGDEDGAAEIMGQIRLKERTVAIQEATHLSAQAKDQAREEVRMDAAIERIEQAYPELRDGSEEYDQDLVDLVLAAQSANIEQKRMSPSMALTAAVETVMKKVRRPSEEAAPAPAKAGLSAATGAGDRKAAQVEKNIAAAAAQPPSVKGIGEDTDKHGQSQKVDVSKMTSEEFGALPEATKARLRGDYWEG